MRCANATRLSDCKWSTVTAPTGFPLCSARADPTIKSMTPSWFTSAMGAMELPKVSPVPAPPENAGNAARTGSTTGSIGCASRSGQDACPASTWAQDRADPPKKDAGGRHCMRTSLPVTVVPPCSSPHADPNKVSVPSEAESPPKARAPQ